VAYSSYTSPDTGGLQYCFVSAKLDGGPLAAGLLSASLEDAMTNRPYDLGEGRSFRMVRNDAVPACFAAVGEGVAVRTITFGDDTLLTGDEHAVDLVLRRMTERFTVETRQVEIGDHCVYCGLGFQRMSVADGGGIVIDVRDAQAALGTYLRETFDSPEVSRRYHVPYSQSTIFDELGDGKGDLMGDRGYYKLVGKCVYLVHLGIFPAAYPLRLLSRRVRVRGRDEEKALLVMASYLTTCLFRLQLPSLGDSTSDGGRGGIQISVEFDATPGSPTSTGTTGAVIQLNGVPIDFVAEDLRIRMVSRATKSHEYLAAARGMVRALRLVRMVAEMPGLEEGALRLPIVAVGDCTSANGEATRQAWGVGMQTFEASAVFLKDLVQVGVARVDWVSGRDNIADGLTKNVVKGVYEARAPAFGLG